MNKSTKGALAAGAAGVLLLGGVGTLAYWTAEGDVDAGAITSGHLALTNPTDAAWTLNGDTVADISTVRVVPGDELEFTGSFEIDAAGDNLEGTVSVTGGGESGTLAPFVDTTTVTAEINGSAATTITEDNDGDTIDVAVTVDFPFGAAVDNASNVVGGLTLDLAEISVTITQTDATP